MAKDRSSPWSDGRKRTFRMLLDKDRMSLSTKEELKLFLQTLRIINSLRSLLKLRLKLKINPDRLESFKDTMELCFLSAAAYYEGLRTYLDRIQPRVKAEYVSESDRNALRRLKKRLNKKDGFLNVAATIRNQVVFHYDSEILEKYIIDGIPKTDWLIGYATGPTINDATYLEPYSCVLNYLAESFPAAIERIDVFNWIQRESLSEIGAFCRILERTANGFLKQYGKLVEGEPNHNPVAINNGISLKAE